MTKAQLLQVAIERGRYIDHDKLNKAQLVLKSLHGLIVIAPLGNGHAQPMHLSTTKAVAVYYTKSSCMY